MNHARSQQGQQGCGREEERTVFPSFHGVGGWSCDPLNGNAPLFCPPAHRPKNRKKCDETVKKCGELVTGAFFEPKKRGVDHKVRSVQLPRCTAVPRMGAPGLPRHRPRPHLTLQAFGRRKERQGWVVCRVTLPLSPARPGKNFSSGAEFLFDTLWLVVRVQLAWSTPVIGLGHSPNNKCHPKTT